MSFMHFDVEFDKTGALFDPSQVDRVTAEVPNLTDVILISHGWNNDIAEAKTLYDNFFGSVDAVLRVKALASRFTKPFENRKFGVIRVFWPSKKFATRELIPAGGVASATSEALAVADRAVLLSLLEKLKHDPTRLGGTDTEPGRVAAMDRAIALVSKLEKDDPDAKLEFVTLLRSILDRSKANPDDGSSEFFTTDPLKLFEAMNGSVAAPPPPNPGGAASLRDVARSVGNAVGGAVDAVGQTISDVAEGTMAAARRLANFTTYNTMKERAGLVGEIGAGPFLRQLRAENPALKFHLVGHSFGGRVVTAAASTLDAGTTAGMTLLQAAYSHNGLSVSYDGRHNGFFRTVLGDRRITGPILITHTKNDVAVGIAYPLASRISRDTNSEFGDEKDPYGGMGRNGAQNTPEVAFEVNTLLGVGPDYAFEPGKVYNLRADQFIMDHGDVAGHQVAYAFLSAVLKV